MTAATALALAGCSTASADDERVLTVYAAASLTDVFAQLEAIYESDHPGVDVVVVHGGSAELAATIVEGAPADVFASANEAQMDVVADLVAAPAEIFATNTLTLVVEHGNPLQLTGLADLARPNVVSVVCAPQVPCGAATLELAAATGVDIAPSSQESSVTDVLGKVAAGQADAGVVYVTDVVRASGVEQVEIDGADAVVNRYPIAPLTGGDSADIAGSFVDLVLGDGQRVLSEAGFGSP